MTTKMKSSGTLYESVHYFSFISGNPKIIEACHTSFQHSVSKFCLLFCMLNVKFFLQMQKFMAIVVDTTMLKDTRHQK